MNILMRMIAIAAWFALLTANVAAQATSKPESGGLTLRGKVESVQLKQNDLYSVMLDIKLEMEFVNLGAKPIILLQRELLFPEAALARKPEDFKANKLLALSAGWPSIDRSEEWTTLRSNLDKPSPPANETRLLLAGESRRVTTSVSIVIPTDPSKNFSLSRKESLATIKELSPVWLRVVCEVWPVNVEPVISGRSQLKFGRRLQERWKDTGILWLKELLSEPMMIDIRTATSPEVMK